MCKRVVSRIAARTAWLALALILAAGAAGPLAADGDIPDMLRQELEGVLKKKVSDLLSQKDKDGIPYKRGAYSKSFSKVDEKTYQVTFHQNTIEEDEPDGWRLKVERLLLTLQKDASGKWGIAKEEVKDTYTNLYRGYLRRDEIYAFDGLSFEKEGLKAKAGRGRLYKRFRYGKPAGFVLTADDLSYEYAPPSDVGYYGPIHHVVLKRNPKDFVFKPEKLRVSCDPETCEELFGSLFKNLTKLSGGDQEAAGAGGAPDKITRAFDEEVKENEKERRESPFADFRRPLEPGHKFWTFRFKRSADEKQDFLVSYDNHDPMEVSVSAHVDFFGFSFFGEYYVYYSEETRKSGKDPYDLELRPDADARDYDLEGLTGTVEVALDDAEAVEGDITYKMTLKRELRELPFSISRRQFPGETQDVKNPKMFINSVQDGDGNELTWVRVGAAGGLVVFPKAMPAGTELALRLQFRNLDSISKLNPSYSSMDRGGWLPFVRFTDMVREFDLTVKAPARFKVLGIGKKVSEKVEDGATITRWVSERPVAFPTVIFGDYIEDGSSIKATKIDGSEIPVRVYVDKISTQSLDTKVFETSGTEKDLEKFVEEFQGGARDIRGKQLKSIADQASNALNLYREIYKQDYPYGKLDLVADPEGAFYGQAPASLIYLGFGVFRGEGRIASGLITGRGGAGADITKFNKDVVAHEVGHQWWGALINNSNFRNYWFIESLAEFSSALFVENVYGKKRYMEKVAEWRKTLLEFEELSSVQNATVHWGGENPAGAYLANVYNKGPYAFHVLRQTFGDEKMIAFLRALAEDLKGKGIVTRDIQRVAEKTFGGTMEWFFDQWIRGIGVPQYALFYTARQTEDGKWLVEGKIKQRVVFGKEKNEMAGVYYRALGYLTFVGHDGKQFRTPKPLLVEGAETPFRLKIPTEPAQVAFNKEGEILAHDTLVNRSW